MSQSEGHTIKYTGFFYRPHASKPETGQIELTRNKATITAQGTRVCQHIEVQSIQGQKDIYLKNNYLFSLDRPLCHEQKRYLQSPLQNKIAWIESFSVRKAMLIALLFVGVLFLLRILLGLSIPLIVALVPYEWERMLGRSVYDTVQATLFEPSNLAPEEQKSLRQLADTIIQANNLRQTDIIFHKSNHIGANALAFAGGPIVVTDDLVTHLGHDLTVAIIAHELAHIEKRHSLHQIVESAGLSILIALLFGADTSLMEEISAGALHLWTLKKSRRFEKEADLTAQTYLTRAHLKRHDLTRAIDALTRHSCKPPQSEDACHTQGSWLSTHPTRIERLNYLSQP